MKVSSDLEAVSFLQSTANVTVSVRPVTSQHTQYTKSVSCRRPPRSQCNGHGNKISSYFFLVDIEKKRKDKVLILFYISLCYSNVLVSYTQCKM